MPFLTTTTTRDPEAPALVDGEGSWSYAELDEMARLVACRLASLGLPAGGTVALFGGASRQFVGSLHGVWRAGLSAAPFNERWTRPEESRALAALAPSVILVGEGHPGPGPTDCPPDTPVYGMGSGGDGPWPHLLDIHPKEGAPAGLEPKAVAVRLLTSGTTGTPRVVEITLDNLLASARGSESRLSLRRSDRWLISLSPAHVGGVALITRAAVVGSSVVLRGAFDVRTFAALAEDGSVTHASLVPTMLHRYLKELGGQPAPSSLRCLLVGGAPVGAGLIGRALDAGIPVALTYGLTEASSQVATAEPDLVRGKPGSVGSPLPGVEVQVSHHGEILARGATVAPGQVEIDGWLHTGDLGRLDDDGHLWVTGRLSDRIISGGLNVDPSEVGAVLASHPMVEEAAVVGVPDEEWGERVVAAVVLSASARWGDDASEGGMTIAPVEGAGTEPGRVEPDPGLLSELEVLARRALSPGKRPRAYRILPTIPRNANGKVDREAIRSVLL